MSTPGVYVEELPGGPRPILGVPTSIAAFVGCTASGPVDEAVRISSFAQFEQTFGGHAIGCDLPYAVSHFFLNGGTDCWIVRVGTLEQVVGDPSSRTGMHALEAADVFNILCLPGVYDVPALTQAIAYAEARRAMMIVDIDPGVNSFELARSWVEDGANASLERSNAAAYFPRVHLADPLQGGAPRSFPSCGVLAGVWARSDRERGVWKAPAGPHAGLLGVQALDHVLTDAQQSMLNQRGLNGLRSLPGYGTVCWGARTLAGADASEWKYVPVRRTALFIEESLDRGTRFAAFEPNGEPLWAQIRHGVGAFMNDLFRRGAFQGASPREAYFVKCDATTTTQMDVERGQLNVLVGFAALKPAEFVTVSIRQSAGSSRG